MITDPSTQRTQMIAPQEPTVVDLLRWRAVHEPEKQAYVYLPDGVTIHSVLTYAELDCRARAWAASLQRYVQPGKRVILTYSDGLEVVTALFGCLYAGVIAVPAPPPDPLKVRQSLPRLKSMLQDAEADLLLASSDVLAAIHPYSSEFGIFSHARLLDGEMLLSKQSDPWVPPLLNREAVAYLQYTSGSTSEPRGVMITHANLMHHCEMVRHAAWVSRESRSLSWLPYFHDYGLVHGLMAPMVTGITAYLMPTLTFLRKPLKWLEGISRHRITHTGGPAFAYDYCIRRSTEAQRASLDLRTWDVASCGAEPIRERTIEDFTNAFAPAGFRKGAFAPAYGLAEFTLLVSMKARCQPTVIARLQPSALEQGKAEPAQPSDPVVRTIVGCGVPTGDTKVAIVDPSTAERCPPGHIGEIWLAGNSMARGYWNRPEESKRIFHARLSDTGEGPFLRTGDLGFYQDGQLFVTGRLKDLIIVRGRNHYPQDIELTAERAHPVMRPGGGAAFSIDGPSGEQLVVVHEVSRKVEPLACEEIASAVRQAVAEYHDLHVFDVVLIKSGNLLKTSSGKVQRNACRSAYLSNALAVVGRSRIEQVSIELEIDDLTLAKLLIVPKADRHEVLADHVQRLIAKSVGTVPTALSRNQPLNAFALDSLRAVSLRNQLENAFGVALPLSVLLREATVMTLVNQILASLSEERADERSVPPFIPVSRSRHLPLSFSQQRMWFLHRLDPESPAYNMPFAMQLIGPLNRMALEHAANAMLERHESFRTTFPLTVEGPVQVIGPPQAARWNVIDLGGLPEGDQMDQAAQLVTEDARCPFDLSKGPLIRYGLIRIDDSLHILLINMHHIIGDQWSFGVLGQEFAAFYNAYSRGQTHSPAPLRLQYADFAVWQREWVNGHVIEEQLAYWRKRLAGVPILALPTDFPRPQKQQFIGSCRSLDLPDRLIEALARISTGFGCTLFMTLLAAFQILLSRYAGQYDIAVGVPIANRTRLSTEGMIGTFVNTLVMRTDLSGNLTFDELLHRVRETALGAYDHQDIPFERLVEELVTERELSQSPLVQVLFNLTSASMGIPEFDGLSWTPFEFDGGAAQFDLTLAVDTAVTKKAHMTFRTDLFDDSTIERMLSQFRLLLEAIAADPFGTVSNYSILSRSDRSLLLDTWNRTKMDYPLTSLPALISKQAAQTPDAVALSMEGRTLTYRELDTQSNQLARYLRNQGLRLGEPIGICLPSSFAMVVGLLGIMKSGGAYVPLDPFYPPDRLKFQVDDSMCRILVTTSSLVNLLPSGDRKLVRIDSDWERICREEKSALDVPGPLDSAYVMYTSGSTGRPKGVEVRHHSLVNLLWSMRTFPGCTQQDTLMSVTTISFDIAGLEIYLPLIVGGRVELVSRGVASDGRLLRNWLHECRPSMMQATPATWRMLIDAGWEGAPALTALCGGEALSRDLADEILARVGSLWNVYGPTETTIWSTLSKIERDGSEITIGRPIANTQLFVLNDLLQPVPIGVPGELYIGGDGVASGYWRRPDLTHERFIPHPFSDQAGGRLYRTGDLVRYRSDGQVVHLGRLDRQIKIRGFRIEIGEIEAALSAHSLIRQTVVTARDDQSGSKQLVAYFIPTGARRPSVSELKTFLQTTLPDYMIPAHFMALDAFPLTDNKKVNVLALPDPLRQPREAGGKVIKPRTTVEVQLTALWQHVLEVTDIHLHDNFFDLGGHSLKAVQLFAYIEHVFGKKLPLATLFQAPTIAQFAKILTASNWMPPWHSLVAVQPSGAAIPVFAVPGIGGNVLMFAQLAKLLGPNQPFYGLQARGLDGKEKPFASLVEMAAHYIGEIQAVQSKGPYRIAGTCTGGVIAYEMAQQLRARNETVMLMIMESWHPLSYKGHPSKLKKLLRPVLFTLNRALDFLASTQEESSAGRLRLGRDKLVTWIQRAFDKSEDTFLDKFLGEVYVNQRVANATLEACASYNALEYKGKLLNVVASERVVGNSVVDTRRMWESLAIEGAVAATIPAPDSGQLFVSPHVEALANILRSYLEQEFPSCGISAKAIEQGFHEI